MPSNSLRAYLDANILFSASHSPRSPFHDFWKLRGISPVTSQYAINEVTRNIRSFEQLQRLRDLLERTSHIPDALVSILDDDVELVPKDRPILAAAVASNIDFLITGDGNHFGHLYGTTVAGVAIYRPAAFLLLQKRRLMRA